MTVTRPYHPFEGQSLAILGSIHKRGRLYLTLILPDQSRSHIPAAWTDLTPTSAAPAMPSATLGSLDDLLRTRAIVDALKRNLPPPPEPTAELAQESARAAVAAVSELPRPPRTRDLPVGSTHRPMLKVALASNHNQEKEHD